VKFQQLRCLVAVHENGLNMTVAAGHLHASQPGVSRQIALLEEELGFQLFERQGRSLVRTTEAGADITERATTILRELQNIRRTSSELANVDGGTLSIATTHTQARYVPPENPARSQSANGGSRAMRSVRLTTALGRRLERRSQWCYLSNTQSREQL
jgi:LysR family cys regulon transcriptional activator